MPSKEDKGITIIELLAAVVILGTIGISFFTLIPRASQVLTKNRQRTIANNLGASYIDQIQKSAYATVDVTPASSFPPAVTNCNCADPTLDMETMTNPVITTPSPGNMTYTLYKCVNYEYAPGGVWSAGCSPTQAQPDPGIKHLRLHLTWGNKLTQNALDFESVIVE